MNFLTRYYVMIFFVVMNLVKQSKQADSVDAICLYGYSFNQDTGRAGCDDGNFDYTFSTKQCHKETQGQRTEGVQCVDSTKLPASDVTCVWWSFIDGSYKCEYYNVNDPSEIPKIYYCAGLKNLERCTGVPLSAVRDS